MMGRIDATKTINNNVICLKPSVETRRATLRFSDEPLQNGTASVTSPNGHIKDSQPPRSLIGVNGNWYDVTDFLDQHPGGPIIKQFIGKDASEVVCEFHQRDIVKNRKPVGTYTRDLNDPSALAFAKLHKYFLENGYFQTSYSWYAVKIIFTFSLLASSFMAVSCLEKYQYLGAFFLAAFWQQCGFFMHDGMHTQITHVPYIDHWFGTIFGTVCFGVNAYWWRAEHILHHALTNTVDYGTGYYDPQAKEIVWAQNEKLYPFFTHWLQFYAIKFQHITFLPFTMFAGRIGIAIDSFLSESSTREYIACVVHYVWVAYLLSFLPTWFDAILFYYVAAVLQGVLHVQLLINHYSKPFYERKDICESMNWYRMQVECNMNIRNPWWFDWFHGGLNFHIEHHLFPLMPRHNFRQASEHIKRACAESGIHYFESGWFEAVKNTLIHLKKSSKHFKLDPR